MSFDIATAETSLYFTPREARLWKYFRDHCRFNDPDEFSKSLYSIATQIDLGRLFLLMQEYHCGYDEKAAKLIKSLEKARNVILEKHFGRKIMDNEIDLCMYIIENESIPENITEISRHTYIGEWVLLQNEIFRTISRKCPHRKQKRNCKYCK